MVRLVFFLFFFREEKLAFCAVSSFKYNKFYSLFRGVGGGGGVKGREESVCVTTVRRVKLNLHG